MARARSAGRGARLRKTWQAITPFPNVTVGITQVILGSLSLALGSVVEATVLRCRGALLCHAVPDAAGDAGVLGLGIMVVRTSAALVGGVSVPGPIDDDGSDSWLWHQYVPFDAINATGAVNLLGSLVARVEIDAKAMRKLPEDSTVALIGQMSAGLFSTVEVGGGMRILVGS